MKPDARHYLHIHLEISRRQLLAALTAALVCGSVRAIDSETITLQTTYPSPAGIYRTFTTTDNTVLARNSGEVGIGTATPGASYGGRPVKVDVNGYLAVNDVYFKNPTDGSKPHWGNLKVFFTRLNGASTGDGACQAYGAQCVSSGWGASNYEFCGTIMTPYDVPVNQSAGAMCIMMQ